MDQQPPIQSPIPPATPQPPVAQTGQPQPVVYVQSAQNPGQTLGIVGIVLAVIGISIVGLPLSIISTIQSSKVHASKVLGIVGVVLNALSMLLGILIIVFIAMAAYSDTQQRAKEVSLQSEALSNANIIIKKAETYYTVNQKYPQTIADFESSETTSLKSAGLTAAVTPALPTSNATVMYEACGATGAEVAYYDPTIAVAIPTLLGDGTDTTCK